jgi:hypothetical protein
VLAAAAGTVARGVGGSWSATGSGADATVLVAIANDDQPARRCLDLELANLRRPPPVTQADRHHAIAETTAAHRELGLLYGYPACCVEAFCDAHVEAMGAGARTGDNALPILRAWLRSRHFDARLDTIAGALGRHYASPLRHLPCRFDCPASIALAERLGGRRVDAVPAVVFADGGFLRLPGSKPDHTSRAVCDVRTIDAQFASGPLDDWPDFLRFLGDAPASLRTEPGWLWLQTSHGSLGQQRVDPPQDAPPWSAAFPLLLPFTSP